MIEYNQYLKNELLNIPFNLFDLISKYIKLKGNIKIAFVGGYIRDLLIDKIHEKSSFKPIDLDIVIEGSSISLAKFIKKNIENVELCLIKEFEIYNTVELNINDFKIDIASARVEKYLSPGLNPCINDSSIKNDLSRRDFTINAIAYEIANQEIYDFYEGIEHIKKKELHLLHNKSIKDDPSRLLRCAKYASRLGFQIDKNSLKQSQKTIKEWPWNYQIDNHRIIFPPGISIRLRMELAEIFKNDNLSEIIKIIYKWDVIELINKDIIVNNNFLRGLKWLKKLNGKKILYLIKDSESLDILCQRLFVNTKDKKILDDFLKIKFNLKANSAKYKNFSPSKWTDLIEGNNLDPETVKLLICDSESFWRPFLKWLLIYRFIKSSKNGEILKKEGWKSGREMGDEIKRLRYLEIDKY